MRCYKFQTILLLWIQWNFMSVPCTSQTVDVLKVNSVSSCCEKFFEYKNGECVSQISSESDVEILTFAIPLNDSQGLNATTVQLRLESGTSFLPTCNNVRSITSIPILEFAKAMAITAKSEGGFNAVNGVLSYNNQTYDPSQYCINGADNKNVQLVTCKPDCSSNSGTGNVNVACIRKCCKGGEYLKVGNNKFNCVSSNGKQWRPKLYEQSTQALSFEEQNETRMEFRYSHPSTGWCPGGEAYFMYEKDYPGHHKLPFRILKDGTVIAKLGGKCRWADIPEDSYCIDGVYPENESEDEEFQESVIFRCSNQSEENLRIVETNYVGNYYWILALVSSFFVLITIIVYGLLWETQNIHGWTLLSFFSSLFFLYVFLAIMFLFTLHFPLQVGTMLCWFIGVILHFSYLSTFCWMSVVNFDLWCTFRISRRSSKTSKKLKRFARYSFFGVGIPSIVVGIAIVLDLMSKTDDCTFDTIVPEYGIQRCFLSSRESLASLVFLYGPISCLLSVNLIFFLLTVRAMYQVKKLASIATSQCNNNGNSQSVRLFGKLFVVMGVTWIFEVITWATHPTTVPWWYLFFDIVNICHGIFIFIIFVCKRSTVRSLEQKYPSFQKFTGVISQFNLKKFCCCPVQTLERSHTLETCSQELEERRKSNDTDVTTAGTP